MDLGGSGVSDGLHGGARGWSVGSLCLPTVSRSVPALPSHVCLVALAPEAGGSWRSRVEASRAAAFTMETPFPTPSHGPESVPSQCLCRQLPVSVVPTWRTWRCLTA